MTPIGHLAVGFAAKRVAPRIPLAVLLAASWLLDALFFVFSAAGWENRADPAPYSHGLLMSVMWSLLAGLVALGISLDQRTGVVVGFVVFSHWLLDFVSWSHLPLLLRDSKTVGLGLIDRMGGAAIFVELALFLPAVASYAAFTTKNRKRKVEARATQRKVSHA